MRKVTCDNCGKEENFERDFWTILPKNFSKTEIDKKNYEFCSRACETVGMIAILNKRNKE